MNATSKTSVLGKADEADEILYGSRTIPANITFMDASRGSESMLAMGWCTGVSNRQHSEELQAAGLHAWPCWN